MPKVKLSLYKDQSLKEVITDIDPESEEWEAICKRCGGCCYDKLVDDMGELIAMTPCRYLDLKTGICSVYESRFELVYDCLKLTPENLRSFDWLPDDCGYVIYFGLRKKDKGPG